VAGLPALMPLTGVNTATDLLLAPAHRRPTHVCFDLRGLTDPARVVALPDARSSDAPAPGTEHPGWQVTDDGDLLTLSATADTDYADNADIDNADTDNAAADDAAALGALSALLAVAWSRPSAAGEQIRVAAADAAAARALARLDISRADTPATTG